MTTNGIVSPEFRRPDAARGGVIGSGRARHSIRAGGGTDEAERYGQLAARLVLSRCFQVHTGAGSFRHPATVVDISDGIGDRVVGDGPRAL